METGISWLREIRQTFACGEADIRTYSPLTLAYIGDGVYDLIIRTIIVSRGNRSPDKLHKAATVYVRAQAQAMIAAAVMDELDEDERTVYKRGCNARPHSIARNATPGEYRRATGLEAVIGWLYLEERMGRILELVRLGIEKSGMEV